MLTCSYCSKILRFVPVESESRSSWRLRSEILFQVNRYCTFAASPSIQECSVHSSGIIFVLRCTYYGCRKNNNGFLVIAMHTLIFSNRFPQYRSEMDKNQKPLRTIFSGPPQIKDSASKAVPGWSRRSVGGFRPFREWGPVAADGLPFILLDHDYDIGWRQSSNKSASEHHTLATDPYCPESIGLEHAARQFYPHTIQRLPFIDTKRDVS
ncbi:hypothetical protein F4805DRAFT_322765 [Annulohypoxylon moriforme]|nr:hypothetical protein F4805DRAFT_322765 [Annulohypoxylon moriforme]